MGQAAWLVDASTCRVSGVNSAALQLLGLAQDQVLDADAGSLVATPEDLAFWADVGTGHLGELCSDTVLVNASGRLVPVTRQIRRLNDPAASAHLLVTLTDRSEACLQQQASDTLVAELQATLESTADGILVTDLAGRIRAFNRRFAQIWGMPQELLLQHQDEAVYAWMRRSVADGELYQQRVDAILDATLLQASERIELHSGQVLERVTQPQHSRGRPCGRVWSFRDLTELVHAGQRIETLSTTDALTGLFNRHQIGQSIGDAIRQARRSDTTLALLVLDLDRFKQINDSLGHAVGDRVLQEAAVRLKASMRQGDVVARLGGDQFALLVHEADQRGAEQAAQRGLAAISDPCSMDGLQFTLTCSIGISMFPGDGQDAGQLLRHAETAMQRAKIGGRAGYRFHQARHDADLRQRMRLDHAMRQALASQRFRLHYQPQIDLRSGVIVGAEALIRWRDPELGEVQPGAFIPVAEESGFIIAIGDWVMAQAIRQAAAWRAAGTALAVSINVSALQFQQPDFVDRVASGLRDHDLPGHLLELELTESVLVQDAHDALGRLSQLADLGVQLAIDDFGTGYSSLSYLKRFPIERLKIDRSFINGVPGDDSDVGIVRAIIQMSRALGMKVIAEGVETEPQRAFLRDAGCDQFQGFLFAPALDALSFEERLRGQPTQRRRHLTLVGHQR